MPPPSNTPPAEPVTLAQAKAWLRVESGDDEDALIAGLIAAARMRAEAHTGRCFTADVPAPITQAILQIVASLYEHRGGDAAPTPDHALALLSPYRILKL